MTKSTTKEHHMTRRTTALAATAAALALPTAAQAHVTVSPDTVPAGGYAKVDFGVPNGCEGSATTSLTLQLPDQVVAATPQVVAGWKITTKEGKLNRPYDGHGEQVTEGVREITWSGGKLPDDHLQMFGLSIRTEGKPGEKAPIKALQKCVDGQTNWIQIPVEGEEEPEAPAPMLTLAEAEDAHGGTAASKDAHGDAAAAQETSDAAAQPVAATTTEDDGDGLAIAGLVLGALGFVAGGAAFVTTRRRA
jgi:uncharacterized protein YcnI